MDTIISACVAPLDNSPAKSKVKAFFNMEYTPSLLLEAYILAIEARVAEPLRVELDAEVARLAKIVGVELAD